MAVTPVLYRRRTSIKTPLPRSPVLSRKMVSEVQALIARVISEGVIRVPLRVLLAFNASYLAQQRLSVLRCQKSNVFGGFRGLFVMCRDA